MKSLFENIIAWTASYTYGQAGRLGSATIGTTPVKYDRNGHPEKVSLDDETWIAYDYDALGRKLSQTHKKSVIGGIIRPFGAPAQPSAVIRPGDEISRTDYVGPCVYREGKISMVLIAGGYIEVTDSGYAYRYYLSDHQGNVRAVIDQDGALVEANDYYPYGQPMPVAGAGSVGSVQPYKYGGKELLSETADQTVADALAGVYDFGARWHSSLSAAFTQPDPKSETYPALSPYAYCAANPIRYTDPTGETLTINGDDDLVKKMNGILEKLSENDMFKTVITALRDSDTEFTLESALIKTNGQFNRKTNTISINSNLNKDQEDILWALGEELYHAY